MSDPIPAEALQAALAHARSQPLLWQYISDPDIRELLEAAAPVLAAQVRRETAEQIAREIETATPFHWTRSQARAWAARVARQIGEDQ
jgi:hypothetical protein